MCRSKPQSPPWYTGQQAVELQQQRFTATATNRVTLKCVPFWASFNVIMVGWVPLRWWLSKYFDSL